MTGVATMALPLLRLQLVRFVLVGVLNTAFSYAVYAAFLALGLPYAAANLMALLIGIGFSFRTQGRLVFGNTDNRLIVRFAACWGVIYAFNVGVIAGLVHLGFGPYAAGALALVPVTLLSFVVQKTLVFSRSPSSTASAPVNR